jgi:hypothetical protein
MFTFGVTWPMSAELWIPSFRIVSAEKALMEIGTSWMFSLLCCAVTVSSSMVVVAGAAPEAGASAARLGELTAKPTNRLAAQTDTVRRDLSRIFFPPIFETLSIDDSKNYISRNRQCDGPMTAMPSPAGWAPGASLA